MNAPEVAGIALRIVVALLPVCLFLASLVWMDSYKLVRLRHILEMIAAGCAAAVLSYLANRYLAAQGMEQSTLTRFVAPLVEEVLKAIPLLVLYRARRIGFLVDAVIFGFACGTGFALVENLYYLRSVTDSAFALWIVRGFGTAVMHGGTTALLIMTAKTFAERRESEELWLALPGLFIAWGIHSLFNQFLLSPVVSAVVVFLTLPPLLLLVFAESERLLQSWLGRGFDVDAELLESIHSGEFADTRPGRYLQTLRAHFEPVVLADMLCFLGLYAELSLRAKGILLMRESGFPVEHDPELEEKLTELRYLRKSIGRTGELALAPILKLSAREVWQLRLLEGGQASAA